MGKSFSFSFANAGKIARTIKRLGPREAVGIDGIPASILKKGVSLLAAPLAHLVNRSLDEGIVPAGFKVGRVFPVYKGYGKSRSDPASYRPVSILCAMSKIIESIVKDDVERHLAATHALPGSQFGFRAKRSCTSALGNAHAGWIKGIQEGKIVGIMAYDLSAAFDTVAADVLLPKLEALGFRGKSLKWFSEYMSNGSQCIVWNGESSDYSGVDYGVRQGSILGPILFLVHVADMHVYLDLDGNAYVVYADDSCLWHAASTWEEVKAVLEEKSAKFAVWAKANGLAMNGAKTQLLVSSNAGAAANLSVRVGVNDIACGRDLELLGVRFDRKMSTAPHVEDMAKAAKQRAAMIARLSQHLPRGRYLQQLANGLVLGKVNHALAAVAAPRLKVDTPTMGALRSVQIAVNNAARSVIGSKKYDHVRVEELNKKAGFPSINALVTKAVALEAWTAYTSCDGHGGGRNPSGLLCSIRPGTTSTPARRRPAGCRTP
jgi:hypothetical protein